jgi:hypothetical protein
MQRRYIAVVAGVALALGLLAETAFAAPPEGEIVSEEVAYEQPMDEAGKPIGPKVKVKKEKHLPDAAALSVAAEKPGGEKAKGKASGRSLQASGCKTVWATRIGRSALGFVTYKFTQEKYFCWTSPRLTNVQTSAYACCTDPVWFYRGPAGSSGWFFAWSGDGRGGHYSFRQGRFEQAVLGKVITSAYPWVKIWVYGNGAWSYQTGV